MIVLVIAPSVNSSTFFAESDKINSLSFLDIKCLESLGFVFKPSKLLELNLQTNIIWKSCDSYHKLNSTENKIQIIDRIFNEKSFQKEIFKRQDLVVVNVLSNYCKLCNTFIKPNQNFFSKKFRKKFEKI